MPVKLEDVLIKMDENNGEVLTELRSTNDKLTDVRVEMAGLNATVKGHGREIGEVKKRLDDHLSKEPTGVIKTPVPSRAPYKASKQDIEKLLSQLKTYGVIGAIAAGAITTILNLLGVL